MIFLLDSRRGAVVALESLTMGASFQIAADPEDHKPMQFPTGIALMDTGELVVSDTGNNRVLIVNPDNGAARALVTSDTPIGALSRPAGVAVTASGDVIVADTGGHRVCTATLGNPITWSTYGAPGAASPGEFVAPTGVLSDVAGRILIADPGAGRLVRFAAPDGADWKDWALPSEENPSRPYALASTSDGTVVVTDVVNAKVWKLDANDTLTPVIDDSAHEHLFAPVGIAALGDDLIIADAASNWVSRWTTDNGSWQFVERVDGRGVRGGPDYASLGGLVVAG